MVDRRQFFTADTHFCHPRIIAMASRPFADVDVMNAEMIARWNARVGAEDEVWHLGDFALGCDRERIAGIFHSLNGRKHLVAGNHDEEPTLELPWESVSEIASVMVGSTRVVLCHYPFRSWQGAAKGHPHLYGHMHGKLADHDLSVDVGVDRWDFAPVTLAEARLRMSRAIVAPEFAEERKRGKARKGS